MKRAAPLLNLSREHHTALSLAQRARRIACDGDEASVRSMAAMVGERFRRDLKPHFDEEERQLLPALAAAGEHQLVARTLADHGDLLRLAEGLAAASAESLLAFADGLIAHVRFEERELFPVAEKYPDCLARLSNS